MKHMAALALMALLCGCAVETGTGPRNLAMAPGCGPAAAAEAEGEEEFLRFMAKEMSPGAQRHIIEQRLNSIDPCVAEMVMVDEFGT